ncbi:hypothetical protein SAMN06265827_10592 [Orenia metallireducens]|uniref:AP2 domain-containing protein n=1 Tax=Orenia metallireducens TaxID=1413210 RepID=A0A285G9S0_9FIRM|nr:hypothetical protein [Orenia metallireducens]SNY19276.1 hypothetical protein SAMN06265827_10592 [Orenia metallireducens]
MPRKIKVNKGDRYGRWTIIKEVEKLVGSRRFLCKCDCGTVKEVSLTHMRNGRSKSCGCYKKKKVTKHGEGHSRLYQIWCDIKQRCLNESCDSYKNYGDRGITFCKEWSEFKNFRKWALSNGYKNNLTIERIDVNSNYSPSNCKWITKSEQSMNRRNSIEITYKNKTKPLKEWVAILPDELNLNYNTIFSRLDRGWSIEKAFETPLKGCSQ